MIRFTWNNVLFDITDVGGGPLSEDIPMHAHARNSYELHFIVKGRGELITDTKEYKLDSGDFFVTGPGIYHSQKADTTDPVQDVFIMLQVVNADKANAVSSVFLSNEFSYLKNFDISPACKLLSEYRNQYADYQSAVSGLAMILLTNITRRFLPASFVTNVSSESLNDRRFVIIEQAFLYTPDLTLSELAEKIGVCERQTQRLLKKYYGKSFREKKKESLPG